MTSRMVFLFGSSRSRRRSATVTSSQPDASRASTISASERYLPVPTKRRERSSTPATTNGSECTTVCTLRVYRRLGKILLHQERPVPAVREALDSVVDRKPEQLVDLDPRLE